MGYLIFTIFFSMWELFCYVFLSICTAQRIELQIILRPPRRGGGGDKSMRSLHPPLESIFFVIWRIFLLFFVHVGAFSYVFLFMHITIRVGVTDCNCRSKLVSQLTNGQFNSRCDDTKAYVDLYRFIMKTGQSASHNRLWQ